MKRILVTLLLIFSIVICLPGCEIESNENPAFEEFNTMFTQAFDNYTINVKTTSPDGIEVNKLFKVYTTNLEKNIDYTVEALNQFIVVDGVIFSPDEIKTVTTGKITGELATQNVFEIPQFKFSYKYIENDVMVPGRFNAKIKDLGGFTGFNVESEEAKFSLTYNNKLPLSMQITYVTENGNTTVITYTFNYNVYL